MLSGAKKDVPTASQDGKLIRPEIDGVVIHEVRNIPYENGVLTELFRFDWELTSDPIPHLYQVRMFRGIVNAWHAHQKCTDRLFVHVGHMKIVLYDAREQSKTRGRVIEVFSGEMRPAVIIIPPGVWHGVQNLGSADCLYLNFPTHQYEYQDPDNYRMPYDSPEIPYVWAGRRVVMEEEAT